MGSREPFGEVNTQSFGSDRAPWVHVNFNIARARDDAAGLRLGEAQ